jgi:exosortase A-associated hydrolase 2
MTGIEGRFLGEPGSRILFVSRRPLRDDLGCVLLVPPFGEEMNKTRPMYADLGRRLSERGFGSLLPDLFGTGDSEGEFRDADWNDWVENVAMVCRWASSQNWSLRGVVATRLGCALVASALRALNLCVERTVFWQPVGDGARFLKQFLRLRVAASMMENDTAESTTGLRSRLRAGEYLEVAGYELAPRLADQLESVRLVDSLSACLGLVQWIEIAREAQAGLSGAAAKSIDRATGMGISVTSQIVTGEPFWSSTEIVRLPELVEHSAAHIVEAA